MSICDLGDFFGLIFTFLGCGSLHLDRCEGSEFFIFTLNNWRKLLFIVSFIIYKFVFVVDVRKQWRYFPWGISRILLLLFCFLFFAFVFFWLRCAACGILITVNIICFVLFWPSDMWDLSSLTRDWTLAPCVGNLES